MEQHLGFGKTLPIYDLASRSITKTKLWFVLYFWGLKTSIFAHRWWWFPRTLWDTAWMHWEVQPCRPALTTATVLQFATASLRLVAGVARAVSCGVAKPWHYFVDPHLTQSLERARGRTTTVTSHRLHIWFHSFCHHYYNNTILVGLMNTACSWNRIRTYVRPEPGQIAEPCGPNRSFNQKSSLGCEK